jgi:hypothetical protein
MRTHGTERDERTVATENASYRWAYLVLSYGLLASAAYRSFAWNDSVWDLLGLVVLGGVVTTAYQFRGRVLSRRWLLLSATAGVLAAALAGLLVMMGR